MSYYVIGGGAASGLGSVGLGQGMGERRARASGVMPGATGRQPYGTGARLGTQRHHVAWSQVTAQGRVRRHGIHGIFHDEDPYLKLLRYNPGAATHGFGAFGAADPGSVCSDWMAGASCTDPEDASCAPARAAGGRAAMAIQQALNDQGYGPIAVDGIFGSQSIAAWDKFADANPGTAHGWPDCAGITTLMSGGGAAPGAAPGGAPSKAGVAFGILAAGLVALGALALLSRKKKHGHHGHGETITIHESKT